MERTPTVDMVGADNAWMRGAYLVMDRTNLGAAARPNIRMVLSLKKRKSPPLHKILSFHSYIQPSIHPSTFIHSPQHTLSPLSVLIAMPHIIEPRPSPTASAATGIGTPPTHPTCSTFATDHSHALPATHDHSNDNNTLDIGDFDDLSKHSSRKQHKRKRDLFSTLPAHVHQQILSVLPPFQMLTISELSRKFYNFVVLGQEMNEVWFRLVKTEEAEQKKRLDWYKAKKLEQEHRQVQMMRSFSSSSTSSTSSFGNGYGPDEPVVVSKQAQRLLNKKQEAATGSRPSTVKAMRRNDRKKNWCQVYVDTILRGNGEDPLESLNQVFSG